MAAFQVTLAQSSPLLLPFFVFCVSMFLDSWVVNLEIFWEREETTAGVHTNMFEQKPYRSSLLEQCGERVVVLRSS